MAALSHLGLAQGAIVFTCLALVAGSAFARTFLGARYITRVGDRVILALMGVSGIGAVAGLLTDHPVQGPLQSWWSRCAAA